MLPLVFCLGAGMVGPLESQQARVPVELWAIDSDSDRDTILSLPYGVAVHKPTGLVYVADLKLPGIVEIDGRTGKVRRTIGKPGNGPGEFGAPQHVAISPDGRLFAVYDVRRGSVDVFSGPGGKSLRRTPVGSFSYLKSMVVMNDTTIVLSGGRPGVGRVAVGVTWVRHESVTGTGPVPARVAGEEGRSFAVQLYAAGGPVRVIGGRLLLAEAVTGDVYEAGLTSVKRLAGGLGARPGTMEGIIQPSPGGRGSIVSFDFTRALAIDSVPGQGYLVAWTDPPRKELSLLLQRPGARPSVRGRWTLNPAVMERFDEDSWIVVEHTVGGWKVRRLRLTP